MAFLKYISFILTLLIPLSAAFADTGKDWKLKIDRENIRVYSRKVDKSKIHEIKAVSRIPSSLSSIVSLLNDVEAVSKWIPNSGETILLKRINDYETLVYGIIRPPWPVSDRDIIVHFKIRQDPATKEVTVNMTGRPDYIPLNEDYVRVPLLKSFWKLTPGPDGFLDVVYQVHAEPGGLLLSWFVNVSTDEVAYDTVKNMQDMIQKEKYKRARLDYIDEKK
ncbi:MAG: hypothetical protein IME96_01340 [Proteobacteria bacterium]|nr:hypothetical protein [Pseudomonadota bacterium]